MTLYDALEVHVELAGETVLAGRAQFHRSRGKLTSTTFQYDQSYLAHTAAYPLDPALQLVSGTQQTQGLPGAFSDSAPDRWGRNLIKKRERLLALQESRRPRDFDDAEFLAGVSDITRQGALRYRAETGAGPVSAFLDPDHDVPRLLRLPELLHAADTASRNTAARDTGDDGYVAVKLLLAAGTGSLGGARPKAAVLDNNGRQLIAKFPHHEDDWDVMAWEATALDLAAAAGVLEYSGRGPRPHQRRYLQAPSSLKDLVMAAGRSSLHQVTWRHGTKATPNNKLASMKSRFIALRVRPANRDLPRGDDGSLPVEWLLAECVFRPESVEEAARVALSYPGAAQTSRPLSWSTMTVKYLCPRL